MWTPAQRGRMASITRKTKRYPSDLTDEEWERIAPLMPPAHRRGRKRAIDFREIINALRYLVRSGCGWEMLPGRLHADDTTVPVLAKGRTVTGRLWNYVRDDHPFGGAAPPAVWFRYSRDRKGEHPVAHLSGWTGIVQSDAYAGYTALAKPGPQPAPVVSARCWAPGRRGLLNIAAKD